eukprot:1141528-Pelagomonas_calceolata.AAC.4
MWMVWQKIATGCHRRDSSGVQIMHMLHADNLCLISNQPPRLSQQSQLMLNRLHWCAQRTGLVINAPK